MTAKETLKIFSDKQVRTVWDDEKEEWFFSIVDVVEVLTDSSNPTDYLKKMRKRDNELSSFLGTNCPQVTMTTKSGVRRKTLAGDVQTIFRLIQSIPSPKAEPFKQWMAQVASERIDEMQDPELSINRAIANYQRLGYSEQWIKNRMRATEVRHDLTEEWAKRGVAGTQYATLTDIVLQSWSGKTSKQYKQYKGLKKENLRDNMTNMEMALNILAEVSTTEISKSKQPKTIDENKEVAHQGGSVARNARLELEQRIGRAIVSPLNANTGMHIGKEEDNKLIE